MACPDNPFLVNGKENPLLSLEALVILGGGSFHFNLRSTQIDIPLPCSDKRCSLKGRVAQVEITSGKSAKKYIFFE